MSDYSITAVTRRKVYSGSAGTGPYAFTFPVISQTDLAVYKNSVKLTLTTDYTVTINSTNGTGSVTLVTAAISTDQITIIGSRTIQRTTDFVTAGDLNAASLNEQLDSQIIMLQQLAEENKRTLKAPVYDLESIEDGGILNMVLPTSSQRANNVLAFDENGNPVATEEIGDYRGNWASGILYAKRDLVKDTSNNNVYRCNTQHTSSGSTPISTNADSTKWDLIVDAASAASSASAAATSATNAASSASSASASASSASTSASTATTQASNASTSASSASTSATNAASSATSASTSASSASTSASSASTSAALAAASVAGGLYSSVIDKSANYTVVIGDAGDLIRVTTTSGAITITLPQISTVTDGFKVAIVKWTGDANAVNIARSGSDTINGATSATIGTQYAQTTFVADFETNQWFAASSGLGSTNVVNDVFSGTGSQTAFTLSGDAGTKNNTYVYIAGVYQFKSTYTLSGTTLTFSTAPPSGTSNIEVIWTQPLAVGTPSNGTVTPAKLSTGGLSWDTSGNVGIGVVPAYQLEIKSANDALVRFINNGATQLSQIQSTNLARSAYAPLSIGGSYTVLETGGTERMRIDSSGIVTGTAGNLMLVNNSKITLSSTATVISTTIPSWAKKLTLAINGLSTTSTSDYIVQIGSGSYTSSGYTSFSNETATSGGATTATTGFVIRNNEGAAGTCYGHMTLTLQDSATNTWVSSHSMGGNATTKYYCIAGGGVVALSGALDRIQITTVGGTDTFDAGSINIQYE